jgi:hypothetical protein
MTRSVLTISQQLGLQEPPPRIPVDGGTAAAVIDLAVPHPEGGFDVLAGPPVIEAVREGRVQLTFRCPYCRASHYHGRHGSCHGCGCPLHGDLHNGRAICTCPVGSGDGHRVAHCWTESSPYRKTGYVLREVTPS